MSLRSLLRRAVLGAAVATALFVAVPAVASAQTISITPCASPTCTNPSSSTFAAGSDSSLTATLALDTGMGSNGAVDTITTQFAAGLLVNLSSTTALGCISASNTSPDTNANCVIGSGTGNGVVPITAYLTPPNTLSASATPPGTTVAGLDLAIGAPFNVTVHGDLSLEQLPTGQLVGVLTTDLSPQATLGGALTGLALNLNGALPDGSPLTRMPSATTPATPTQMTVKYVGATEGPTNASPDVSAALTSQGSLAYAPTLSGSAKRDASDEGAAVSTTLSQPAGQAASLSVGLSVPETVLAPNPNAIGLAEANGGEGTAVGTATATTPLLPAAAPLTGQAFLMTCTSTTQAQCIGLTTSQLGLVLSLRFTSPFPVTVDGTINAGTGAVTFPSLPDVPLSTLGANLNGGPDAPFIAPCAATSGTLSGSFTGQNGLKANPTAPFSVSGCPATTVTTVGKPSASGGSLTGLASGHPKLHFKVSKGTNAPGIKTVSVGVASGLSFHSSKVCTGKGKKRHCTTKVKGLSVSGGTVKSAKVSGGRLVITLKSASSKVSITVKGPGLKETKALRKKVKKHKVKKLTVTIKVTDAKGTKTTLSLKLPV